MPEVDNQEDFELENDVLETEDDELDEATDAANSLRPGSRNPETWSRSEILNKLMAYAAGLAPQDLTHFFHQSIAQIGHEADNVPDGAQATNQASISAKPSFAVGNAVKEDVADLFAGQENLSEGFVDEAATLFEAAVQARVTLGMAQLEEEAEARLEEEIQSTVDELAENISDYMDYIAEKWMEENELAVENGFRAEAVDQFIFGLRDLFAENFIDVPEEKVDILDEMAQTIEELQGQLEESINENIDLANAIVEAQREAVFDEVTEGLVATEAEQFRSLVENVEFKDMDTYSRNLELVREKYFPTGGSRDAETLSSGLLNEDAGLMVEEDEPEKQVSPSMRPYVDSLSRIAKNGKIAAQK